MSDLKIAVLGAAGRMGRTLVATIHAQDGCVVAGGTEHAGSDALGKDVGELAGVGTLGIAVSSDTAAVIGSVDAIVDFTVPEASVAFAEMQAVPVRWEGRDQFLLSVKDVSAQKQLTGWSFEAAEHHESFSDFLGIPGWRCACGPNLLPP